jgi:hypothetical protein
MRIRSVFLAALGAVSAVALSGCGGMRPEQFADAKPTLHLEQYFAGQTRAWGFVEDFGGDVTRQFVVDITGRWDGTSLTLVEDFVWNDGEKEQRIWVMTKTGPDRWEGRTADAIGVAQGRVAGNALNFRYDFNLKTGSGRTRVSFDDWMFLQPDGVLLNRATIRKFGITVAEVTIAFRKDAQATAGLLSTTGQAGALSVAAE